MRRTLPVALDAATYEQICGAEPANDDLLADSQTMASVARLVQASDAARHILTSDPLALSELSVTDEDACLDSADLERWTKRRLLAIASADLGSQDTLEQTAARLSRLAEQVVGHAVAVTGCTDLGIVAMGKLGGGELNFVSDIDLMVVGTATTNEVRSVLDIVRPCFQVDLGLRPEGNAGALVRSVDAYVTYWQKWASPWEFQALLKARPITHNDVSTQWMEAAQEALWGRVFSSDDIEYVRKMKQRAEAQVRSSAQRGNEIKRGQGGLRDIEFSVQLLQLVHGRQDVGVRSPNTLVALAQLDEGGYIGSSERSELGNDYRFLRTVEHRLQLVNLSQTHLVPAQDHLRHRIAKSMNRELSAFDIELRQCQARVRQSFEHLYFRPLLEQFAGNDRLGPGHAGQRVAALGFRDTERTKAAVAELSRGLSRHSRLMRQMMPLILGWLSTSPDPDQGLLGLRQVAAESEARRRLVEVFRDSPEAARRICHALGSGTRFSRTFLKHPHLLSALQHQPAENLNDTAAKIHDVLQLRTDAADRIQTLTRFVDERLALLGTYEVLDLITDAQASEVRSVLADEVIQAVLGGMGRQSSLAVIALGRWGGNEMSPASDLDAIVIHSDAADHDDAVAGVHQLLAAITGATPAQRIYQLDLDLRPEGRNGPLTRSVASSLRYYQQWAETWERQALIRARPAAGSPVVAEAFMAGIRPFVWSAELSESDIRHIRHLKVRIEQERISPQEDRDFHLKLGPGALSDVEWTVQFLQLRHKVEGCATLHALAELHSLGHLDDISFNALSESWQFCQRVRNRASLVAGDIVNSLPTDEHNLRVLARSLGTTPADMRETYLRNTRRARRVVEQLFYQSPIS